MHYPKVLERVDFPEQIFHRSFSLGAPDTFKYRAELVQAFTFQPVRHESGIFGFECIKACLRHDLSRHVEISATLHKIEASDQNSLPPMTYE